MNVLMPQLGETVTEGTVANWHKKVGDKVAADEIILDIETDKVSMEIPAPTAGVITRDPRARRHDGRGGHRARRHREQRERVGAPRRLRSRSSRCRTGSRPAAAAEASPPSWYAAMPPAMNDREGAVRTARGSRLLGAAGGCGYRRSRGARQPSTACRRPCGASPPSTGST